MFSSRKGRATGTRVHRMEGGVTGIFGGGGRGGGGVRHENVTHFFICSSALLVSYDVRRQRSPNYDYFRQWGNANLQHKKKRNYERNDKTRIKQKQTILRQPSLVWSGRGPHLASSASDLGQGKARLLLLLVPHGLLGQ